jgi:serine/threonine protein kinase
MPEQQLERGQTLDRYRIEEELGAGGMGAVYRAWDSTLHRWVALKVVPKGASGGRAERLLGEARAAAALHHTNIVAVFDVGEARVADQPDAPSYAFVSMDLVDGRPLRDYGGDASGPQEKCVAWLLQIASALRAAHAAGLVHRDMKPDNVMITKEGDVRVLDFGLAKSFSVDVEAPTAHESGQPVYATQEGFVSGTPAYMAPEQLAGGPPSPLWDQYAWGVLACELLTGKHPRSAGLVSASGWVKPESLAHVPDGVARVVARAMAPASDQRFPSMDAVVGALGGPVSSPGSIPSAPSHRPVEAATPTATTNAIASIADTVAVPVHPNAPVQPRAPSRLRRAWALVALGAVGLVGAGAGVMWARARPGTPAPSSSQAPNVVAASAPSSAVALAVPPPSASSTPAPSASPTQTVTAVVHPPRPSPPPKLEVEIEPFSTIQYDRQAILRVVRPVKPLVLACLQQHTPRTLPAAMSVDLELWSIGDNAGQVRDVRAHESPALVRCFRDVFMPLSFGPGRSPNVPPGAVGIRVVARRQ